MENKKNKKDEPEKPTGIAIALKTSQGKTQVQVQSERASTGDLSLAIANLEMVKADLVDALAKLTKRKI